MEKHEGFREQIETRDAEIFVSIPCFLVLMALDQEDRKLCQSFCPDMFKNGHDTNLKFQELKAHFEGRNIEEDFELYNILEKTILDLPLDSGEEARVEVDEMKIEQILRKIKILAIQLSRSKPQDWNQFMDVLLI